MIFSLDREAIYFQEQNALHQRSFIQAILESLLITVT